MAGDFRYVEKLPRSEPPARTGDRRADGRRPGSTVSAPRRTPHSGRSGSPTPARSTAGTPPTVDAHLVSARRAADRLLRLALEVVDRRRNPRSLHGALSPAVVGMVGALSTTAVPGRALGIAVVRTVHVRANDQRTDVVEVFGTYSRGDRVFAIAAQVAARRRTDGPAWMLTGLRLS